MNIDVSAVASHRGETDVFGLTRIVFFFKTEMNQLITVTRHRSTELFVTMDRELGSSRYCFRLRLFPFTWKQSDRSHIMNRKYHTGGPLTV